MYRELCFVISFSFVILQVLIPRCKYLRKSKGYDLDWKEPRISVHHCKHPRESNDYGLDWKVPRVVTHRWKYPRKSNDYNLYQKVPWVLIRENLPLVEQKEVA